MARSCCPSCRLRFSRATATHLRSCPFCAGPLQMRPASEVVGLKLVAVDPLLDDEPAVARSVALPPPVVAPPVLRGPLA